MTQLNVLLPMPATLFTYLTAMMTSKICLKYHSTNNSWSPLYFNSKQRPCRHYFSTYWEPETIEKPTDEGHKFPDFVSMQIVQYPPPTPHTNDARHLKPDKHGFTCHIQPHFFTFKLHLNAAQYEETQTFFVTLGTNTHIPGFYRIPVTKRKGRQLSNSKQVKWP